MRGEPRPSPALAEEGGAKRRMRGVVIGAALTPTLSREERERGISTDLLHEMSRRRLNA